MVEGSSNPIHNNNNNGEAVIRVSAPKQKQRVSVCMGCGQEIYDQFILRVSPDLEWHAACLKCSGCNQYLDETCTCFVRDGKTYCKADYIKLFGAKCDKCSENFNKNDYVMRARHKIYHVQCFHCVACSLPLRPGDEFALRDDGLYCKADHDILEQNSLQASLENGSSELIDTSPMAHPLGSGEATSLGSLATGLLSSMATPIPQPSICGSLSSSGGEGESRSSSKKDKKDKPKTTRVRTVLNEKQLHTLRTCYAANPRPDALMKEQLVEMTGLSPRVIRVWFQNKRCKDKKRQIMMKQMQQQQEKNQALNGVRMQGVGPLIAASPTRHDPMSLVSPIDIQQFQQNPAMWATPLRTDTGMDSQTPFQQLIHGFGDPADPNINFLNPGGSSAGPYNTTTSMDSELDSFSPQMAPSELSSPSCSE